MRSTQLGPTASRHGPVANVRLAARNGARASPVDSAAPRPRGRLIHRGRTEVPRDAAFSRRNGARAKLAAAPPPHAAGPAVAATHLVLQCWNGGAPRTTARSSVPASGRVLLLQAGLWLRIRRRRLNNRSEPEDRIPDAHNQAVRVSLTAARLTAPSGRQSPRAG